MNGAANSVSNQFSKQDLLVIDVHVHVEFRESTMFVMHLINYSLGPKHRLRFLCEVRVNGVAYVGAGNSTNKKDAEKNAARDFVNFLVRTGRIEANEVPATAIEQGGALPARVIADNVPVFQVRIC